jgi:hypothetical protein
LRQIAHGRVQLAADGEAFAAGCQRCVVVGGSAFGKADFVQCH